MSKFTKHSVFLTIIFMVLLFGFIHFYTQFTNSDYDDYTLLVTLTLVVFCFVYFITSLLEKNKLLLVASSMLIVSIIGTYIFEYHPWVSDGLWFTAITTLYHVFLIIALALSLFGVFRYYELEKRHQALAATFSELNGVVYFKYNHNKQSVEIDFSKKFTTLHNISYNQLNISFKEFLSFVDEDDRYLLYDFELSKVRTDYTEISFRIKYPEMSDYTWLYSKMVSIKNNDFVTIDVDVSKLKSMNESIKESDRALSQTLTENQYILEHTSDFVSKMDVEGTILYASPSFEKVYNQPIEQIIGKNVLSVDVHTDEHTAIWFEDVLEKGHSQDIVSLKTGDSTLWIQWHNKMIENNEGKPMILSVGHDITTIMQFNEKLEYASRHDALTGLFNHEGLKNALEKLSPKKQYMFTMIALSDFNSINEFYSHRTGDDIIKDFAIALKHHDPQPVITARISRDKFLIVFQLQSIDLLDDYLLSISAFENHIYRIRNVQIEVKANMGYAVYPKDAKDLKSCLGHAELALTSAIENQNLNIAHYQHKYSLELEKKMTLIQGLKEALKNDRIAHHFQPIIDVNNQTVIGYEALMRWEYQPGKFHSPEMIFEVVKAAGMATELDVYLIKKALKTYGDYIDKHAPDKHQKLSLNLSPATLLLKNIHQILQSLIALSDIKPENIIIEVSENTFVENTDVIIERIQRLKSLGLNIALDDFGKDYSSLSTLTLIDFDIIKIDKFFINYIEDERYLEIIKMILKIADKGNKIVIAEGVETENQSKTLKKLNCIYQQGYYHGKPQPLK